jgi:hypothetical protein
MELVGSAIFNELVDHGVMSEKGVARTDLLNHLRMYRMAQLAYENALGMTPSGRLSIKGTGTKAALDFGRCNGER